MESPSRFDQIDLSNNSWPFSNKHPPPPPPPPPIVSILKNVEKLKIIQYSGDNGEYPNYKSMLQKNLTNTVE